MPCITGRKGWSECGLVIEEADIGVLHDQPGDIYGRKYVLILHKYF